MPIKVPTVGPRNARILVVGEHPTGEDEAKGYPFAGHSGDILTRLLHEAGVMKTECYFTYVCKYRPPGGDLDTFYLDSKRSIPNELLKEGIAELLADIEEIQPKLIIGLGDAPLWALTGQHAIMNWRGSMLEYRGIPFLPTVSPVMVSKVWEYRPLAVRDLSRVRQAFPSGWPKPKRQYMIRPQFDEVMDTLGMLLQRARSYEMVLASDLETRNTHIACHGIAWSYTEAICIPNLCVERPEGYWTLEQDLQIWERERALLTHENVEVVGQNYLYDAQYFARRRGYIPRCRGDTMVQQHVAYSGLQKGLGFLSSMYRNYHKYWKDEGKLWDPKKTPEDRFWEYNCDDACATYEIYYALNKVLAALALTHIYEFQMELWHAVLEMMLRGVRIDTKLREKYAGHLTTEIIRRQLLINSMLGFELNVRSHKQMHTLFYGEFKLPVVFHRKTKRPTLDDDALQACLQREPLLKPLINAITETRSLNVFLGNFIQAPIDADSRMRTSFNITGTETYRFSSSENAFGTGTNLQNIPKGDEDSVEDGAGLLPNVRKLFIPEPGYEIADIDLAGADAQVVAWEAGDEDLKAAFRSGIKIHAHNAKAMYGAKAGPDGKAEPYYTRIKAGVHLTNYGGQAPTAAKAMRVSEYEAREFQREWFRLHPGIREWHERVQYLLETQRQVTNKFGYRRFYFERISDLLPEALAWIPQSTVACVANRALVNIHKAEEFRQDFRIRVYNGLQVHDSLVVQYPTFYRTEILRTLRKLILVPVPYDDPLTIQWGLKTSTVSWGDCQSTSWPS